MGVKVSIIKLPDSESFIAFLSNEKNLISSYKSAKNVVGNIRWEGVSNGRYQKHHPVWDKSDSIVGYLVGGVRDLGYTYCCLYSDRSNRFFVSHVPFGVVWGGGTEKSSFISTVEATGKFRLFKQGIKFERTFSIKFPYDWVGSELIYRFINDGEALLCVTGLGFCVINIYQPSSMVKTLFGNDYAHMVTGATLSPNTRLLAITMSEWSYTDPVAGEEIYKNTFRIYDVKSGELIGSQNLEPVCSMGKCNIRFSEDGSLVSVSSDDFNNLYKLSAASD